MILSTIILGILPYLSSGVIDTTNVETLGLTMTDDTKTVTIFSPDDETHHYANGVVMTAFKDVLYCMWQSSKTDEDAPETCVMYSKSTDEGVYGQQLLHVGWMDWHEGHTHSLHQRLAQGYAAHRRLHLLHI